MNTVKVVRAEDWAENPLDLWSQGRDKDEVFPIAVVMVKKYEFLMGRVEFDAARLGHEIAERANDSGDVLATLKQELLESGLTQYAPLFVYDHGSTSVWTGTVKRVADMELADFARTPGSDRWDTSSVGPLAAPDGVPLKGLGEDLAAWVSGDIWRVMDPDDDEVIAGYCYGRDSAAAMVRAEFPKHRAAFYEVMPVTRYVEQETEVIQEETS